MILLLWFHNVTPWRQDPVLSLQIPVKLGERNSNSQRATQQHLPVSANVFIFPDSFCDASSIIGTICFSFVAVKVGVRVFRMRFHVSSREKKSPELRGGLGLMKGGRFGNFQNSLTIICLTISGSETTITGVRKASRRSHLMDSKTKTHLMDSTILVEVIQKHLVHAAISEYIRKAADPWPMFRTGERTVSEDRVVTLQTLPVNKD